MADKKIPLEATLYLVDGTTETVSPKNGYQFNLKELQAFVDGYIEICFLSTTSAMVFNEEGKREGLQVNEKATEIFFPIYHQELVGNVLLCDAKMLK